jgi:hypothetical protein
MDLECWHVCYYMGESKRPMAIWQIDDLEGMWIVVPINDQYMMLLVLSNVSGGGITQEPTSVNIV